MSTTIRKTLLYVFFLGLACLMMWYLYRKVSWKDDILPGLRTANWLLIGLSFALGYTATILRGLRWNLMLEPLGYRAPEWTNIHAVAFGYCMNNLIPRSGELARCTMLNRAEKIPVDKLIGTVILERIIDLILLATILLLAFILKADALASLLNSGQTDPSDSGSGTLLLYLAGAGILGIGLFVVIMRIFSHLLIVQKIRAFIVGMLDGLKSILQVRQKLLFIAYSVGIWLCWVLMTFSVLKALDATAALTFADTIFFIGAGSLGMIVPTPGGAGAFHGMSVLAFEALGYPGTAGKIFALISWSGKTMFDILIGALGFFLITRKIKV